MPSRQAAYQARNAAKGRCRLCSRKQVKGSTLCATHLLANRERVRAATQCQPWRQGHCGRPPILKPGV